MINFFIVIAVFDYFFDEGIDLREIPSSSYNSDCLADAITCYVAYDEYDDYDDDSDYDVNQGEYDNFYNYRDYSYEDMIQDAFEGDASLLWNID